jgi:squalene-hopene/tetraprenyl-beta-curcumene cyclase
MRVAILAILILGMCLLVSVFLGCSHPHAQLVTAWNQKAATTYLDQREGWWMEWSGAARDHGTFCVSCHTSVAYALSRPTLRTAFGEKGPSVNERKLLENVRKRVQLWKEVEPFYRDQGYKAAESRGTESVLNALILASYDGQGGRLSDDTRAAFDNMWALQLTDGTKKGAWSWLRFDLEPWEANDSQFYGAALAAVAAGTAPENYLSTPAIQSNVTLLREYLDREYPTQSTINRVMLLWASTKLPGLLQPQQQQAIVNEVLTRQQADGGWELSSLAYPQTGWGLSRLFRTWLREDGSSQEQRSDGYATGLIVLVLPQAGLDRNSAPVRRGVEWLMSNQNKTTGSWPSYSLNKRRNPSSDTGRFMTDAATAYAVLALTEDQKPAAPLALASEHRHSFSAEP